MNAQSRSTATPLKTTLDVVNADSIPVGRQSSTIEPQHRAGDTVDKVDQVSSITLLGLAIVGAGVTLVFHWLLG